MKIIKEFLTIKKTQLENEEKELSKLDRIIYQQRVMIDLLIQEIQIQDINFRKMKNEQRKKNKK